MPDSSEGFDGAHRAELARADGEPASPGVARVAFLGGVGEVGRNMAAVELDGRMLVLDCGLSFPHAEMPGIDLVLPDFEYVRLHAERVEAIVLTHGHEDHIGAVPYLLREFDERVLPVFGRRSRSRC
jgi:ribonuclease J